MSWIIPTDLKTGFLGTFQSPHCSNTMWTLVFSLQESGLASCMSTAQIWVSRPLLSGVPDLYFQRPWTFSIWHSENLQLDLSKIKYIVSPKPRFLLYLPAQLRPPCPLKLENLKSFYMPLPQSSFCFSHSPHIPSFTEAPIQPSPGQAFVRSSAFSSPLGSHNNPLVWYFSLLTSSTVALYFF